MDFFDQLNITSQFYYGKNHFNSGFKNFFQSHSFSDGAKALSEVLLGSIELIPIFGIIPSFIERKIKNWTLEDRLYQRTLCCQKEIESKSYKLQEAYFEAFSSSTPKESQVNTKFLDNSLPDLQVFSLIRDLKHFIQKQGNQLSSTEKAKLEQILSKLEVAKPIATLISTIILSPTLNEKKTLHLKLKELVKEQLSKLPVGESLIIPSGYMNGNIYDMLGILYTGHVNGHMLLMEVKREEEEFFDINFFNTGEGLNYYQLYDEKAAEDEQAYPLFLEGIEKKLLLDDDFLLKLTHFSYNDDTEENYSSQKIYNCVIDNLQPKYIRRGEKSYHSQGIIANCSKKSLQVWLHKELKDLEHTYRDFRIFKLENKIKNIKTDSFESGLNYQHSIYGWGSTSSRNPIISVFQACRGFFLGRRMTKTFSKQVIETVRHHAEKVLQKRKNKKQKIGTHYHSPFQDLWNLFNQETQGHLSAIIKHASKLKRNHPEECIKFVCDTLYGQARSLKGHETIINDIQKKYDANSLEAIKAVANWVKDQNLITFFSKLVQSSNNAKALEFNQSLNIVQNPAEKIREWMQDESNKPWLDSITKLSLTGETIFSFTGKKDLLFLTDKDFADYFALAGNNLTEIPEEIAFLENLKELTLERHLKLCILPDFLNKLKNLEILHLKEIGIHFLPDSFGHLPKLQTLTIADTPIESLPNSFSHLQNLQILIMKETSLRFLPRSFGDLKNLRELTLYRSLLEALPASFVHLHNLHKLYLNFTGIQNLPKAFGNLQNLEEISLEFNSDLRALPLSMGNLKKLKTFYLTETEMITLRPSIEILTDIKNRIQFSEKFKHQPLPDWVLSED